MQHVHGILALERAQAPAPPALRGPLAGPNTGGKTVALKTVGLMALMAKAGLFLPVDAAQVRGVWGLAKRTL